MAFHFPFTRKPKPTRTLEQKLGARSPLVLAKIGYDMRVGYHDLIEQPLPEEIRKAAERLPDRSPLKPVE